ncbi:hypothetical protein N2152v2_007362 [Parachlorella kessleri]
MVSAGEPQPSSSACVQLEQQRAGNSKRSLEMAGKELQGSCQPRAASCSPSSATTAVAHQSKRPRVDAQESLTRCRSLDSDATHLDVSHPGGACTVTADHSQDSQQDYYPLPESAQEEISEEEALLHAQHRLLEDLAEANDCLAAMCLPGGLDYVPVAPNCCMVRLAAAFDIPAIALCLGASYYQRLLMQSRPMQAAAAACGFFVHTGERWVTDRIPFSNMFTHMLLYVLGRRVSRDQAEELENACLVKLDWRLGPYFNPEH